MARSAAATALVTEYSAELRIHTRYVTPSSVRVENRSRTFWSRWKSWANQSPNEPKRSPMDFVEAMNNQKSGSRKYARNASMNSVGTTLGRRPAGRRWNREAVR